MKTIGRVIGCAVVAVAMWSGTAAAFDSMHGAVPVAKLNYDSLYEAATPIADAPQGRTLMTECIARYGGAEKLAQLASFRLTYRMKAFMHSDTIEVTKLFSRHHQYSVSKKSRSVDESRIINGFESWFVGQDTVITLDGGRFKAELFSYLTLAMPLAMETERFDGIRYGTRPGDSLEYIYMNKVDTLIIVLGIDPKDHLIKTSEGMIRQGESNFVFINRFSDFRDVDSYLFPHTLINISMGLEVARSHLTRVDVNTAVSDADFRPKAIADLRRVY